MISDVFLDHLPPTRLVQWIHNAIPLQGSLYHRPIFISPRIHCSIQLRIWNPLTWVTYVIEDRESPEVLMLRKCGILDLHAPLLEWICYCTCQGRLSNLICPPHYLIIRVFRFCRFGVGTPAIGEAVGFRRINWRPKQDWHGPHSSVRDISWYSSWLQQLNRSRLFSWRSKPKHFFTSQCHCANFWDDPLSISLLHVV